MFFKSKRKPVQNAATDSARTKPSVPSIISQSLTVRGDLISDGEVQIDGTIHGDISTATLLVGETAEINGEIKANRVRVHGRVNGQITAEFITLAKAAHVAGNIIHEDLSIEKGAYLEGHCKPMEDHKAEAAIKEKTAPEKTADATAKESAPPTPLKPSQSDGTSAIKKVENPSSGTDKAASV